MVNAWIFIGNLINEFGIYRVFKNNKTEFQKNYELLSRRNKVLVLLLIGKMQKIPSCSITNLRIKLIKRVSM